MFPMSVSNTPAANPTCNGRYCQQRLDDDDKFKNGRSKKTCKGCRAPALASTQARYAMPPSQKFVLDLQESKDESPNEEMKEYLPKRAQLGSEHNRHMEYLTPDDALASEESEVPKPPNPETRDNDFTIQMPVNISSARGEQESSISRSTTPEPSKSLTPIDQARTERRDPTPTHLESEFDNVFRVAVALLSMRMVTPNSSEEGFDAAAAQSIRGLEAAKRLVQLALQSCQDDIMAAITLMNMSTARTEAECVAVEMILQRSAQTRPDFPPPPVTEPTSPVPQIRSRNHPNSERSADYTDSVRHRNANQTASKALGLDKRHPWMTGDVRGRGSSFSTSNRTRIVEGSNKSRATRATRHASQSDLSTGPYRRTQHTLRAAPYPQLPSDRNTKSSLQSTSGLEHEG